MKMTVSVATLLFLMTVSVSVKESNCEVWQLDMAENSVDDSFKDCTKKMYDLVTKKYMEKEKLDPNFAAAWNNALNQCKKGSIGKYQSAAIYMYTQDPSQNPHYSHKTFNSACREGKEMYKSGGFKFYTMYFFLTDAIQKLKKKLSQRWWCVTSYRRTKITFEKVAVRQTVRFGSFTSASLNKNLNQFGNESCFEIKTCYGAKLKNYSALKHEQEVLIPPYEVFRITAINKMQRNNNKLVCKMVYELESVGERSDLECIKTNPPPLWGLHH
ncbi:hypothetical protein NFI96_033453 [Prochilodus magdalenae]|nr:hypothetical protein NFI96_033453 [Prochilodus magdalenae]